MENSLMLLSDKILLRKWAQVSLGVHNTEKVLHPSLATCRSVVGGVLYF